MRKVQRGRKTQKGKKVVDTEKLHDGLRSSTPRKIFFSQCIVFLADEKGFV